MADGQYKLGKTIEFATGEDFFDGWNDEAKQHDDDDEGENRQNAGIHQGGDEVSP